MLGNGRPIHKISKRSLDKCCLSHSKHDNQIVTAGGAVSETAQGLILVQAVTLDGHYQPVESSSALQY